MQHEMAAGTVSDFGSDGHQFLTFALASEEYGVEILRVQEIKGYSAITPLPNAPSHVKGVMNLRGAVVPVIDLRVKFGLGDRAYDKFTVIIVVTVGTRIVGLLVDAVSDVLSFAADDVSPPPALDSSLDTSFLRGIAKVDERLIALLDIDRVVGLDEAPVLVA